MTSRLTRAQVREVDRRAIEEYNVPGIVLMENAARGVVDVVLKHYPAAAGEVLILCGGGNNGGDGLAVARHLYNHGYPVTIALATDPARYQGDALINWRITQAMGLQTVEATANAILRDPRPRLLIDAIFGTGLAQPPRDPFPALADAANRSRMRVLAIDVPSGLDCDTGEPLGPCIRASRTVTFVAEKAGFANPAARQYTGEVTVADIGCPRELIQAVSQ